MTINLSVNTADDGIPLQARGFGVGEETSMPATLAEGAPPLVIHTDDAGVSEVIEFADKYLLGLGGWAEMIGTKVYEISLSVAQITALGNLLIGFVGLFLAIRFGRDFLKNWEKYYKDDNPMKLFSTLVLGIIGTFASLMTLTNIWNWAGPLYPEAWIAAKILGII